jgi:Holliday junction resolvase RusA-like endonuclease
MPRNRVSVSIYYQVPDRRKRDIDGIIKAVLDAGKLGGAYPDDSIIKELHVYKEPPKKGERGSIVVVVRGR